MSSSIKIDGLFKDGTNRTAFLKDSGCIQFSKTTPPRKIVFELLCLEAQRAIPDDFGLTVAGPGGFSKTTAFSGAGRHAVVLDWDVEAASDAQYRLDIRLEGVEQDNQMGGIYKWMVKCFPIPPWSTYWNAKRRNRLNRLFRIQRVVVDDDVLLDYAFPYGPANRQFDIENRKLGINVIGWFRGRLGIGESARSSARACLGAGVPHAFLDLRTPCLADMSDTEYADALVEENPMGINLFHINPPESHDLEHHYGASFFQNRYNIAYWAWELPEFPDEWVEACKYYDEIWCPSRFVAEAISKKVNLPTVVMPHSILTPELEERDWRSHFNLPKDLVLFLFAFDFNSYLERKNPHGVIEAFKQAFPGGGPAGLILKYHSHEGHPEDYARFRAALEGVAHVYEISESVSRAEITGLQAACDVFISLHCSEGFGLNLAECMAMGKPVIATDWSGSTDFIHEGNGRPIWYERTPLTETHGPYKAGQSWAEPDLEDAANAIRELTHDPDLRARLGERAKATIEEEFSPEAVGKRYLARIKWIKTWFKPEGRAE